MPGNSRFKIFFLSQYFHKSNSKDSREYIPDPKMMFLRHVLQSGQSQDNTVQIQIVITSQSIAMSTSVDSRVRFF